ncbi:MAG TPA: uroporphyrinogen decarboxylase family protein [Candidatus Krumholzibacteria bacterium]|nr:uroporphyrinogen decarboxylase family protein [Candidatus Krumholzibacteria bacterium]
MNGMQRLLAAIDGTPADRIPIFCNLIDQGARELGLPPQAYFADGALVAEAQLRMRRRWGHDNLWSLFYVGKEAELLGCRRMVYADHGPPNVGEMVIRTLDDIDRLEVPASVADHPAFAEELKCIRLLREAEGGQTPICAYITATMTLPSLLMGMEKWLPLLLHGPAEPRDRLLAKCHELFVKEIAAYREAGADVLVYSNPFGSTDLVPMKFFLERSLPWIRRDVEAVGADGLVYYCGSARFNRVIDAVAASTGIRAWYLSPLDDVAEGKAAIAGRGLCCGVINDIPMIDWTPAQVRAETRRLIEAGKPGGHFLFGTLLMPLDIPDANIQAMMDAAVEYGSW